MTTANELAIMCWDVFDATRVETFLFLSAVLAYFALFGNVMPNRARLEKLKVKKLSDDDYTENSEDSSTVNTSGLPEIEESFKIAVEKCDYKTILKQWNAMKKHNTLPSVSLAPVVEAMLRFRREQHVIVRELKVFVNKFASELDVSCLNDVLESLAKRMDFELMDRVKELITQVGFEWDSRTYEIFLSKHFTARSFEDVQKLASEMGTKNVQVTTRASVVLIKTALKTSDFEQARQHFRALKDLWNGGSISAVSSAPRHIVSQIVDLACKEHRLRELLPAFEGVPITEDVLNTMLNECTWQQDASLTNAVETLARVQEIALSDRSYGLLMKSYSGDEASAHRVLDDLLARDQDMSPDLALACLGACAQFLDVHRADKLRGRLNRMQVPVLSAFIRFYIDHELFEKACDLYEQEEGKSATSLDPRLERVLMNAALRCGRSKLASALLSSSPSDVAKHFAMIKKCASEDDLDGAVKVFEMLKANLPELNSIIYNTMIDACVHCNNISAAEEWMRKTKEVGMADVVSYNTLIKAHLSVNRIDKARRLIDEMKQNGLQPNRVTFNELINAMVVKGDRPGVWSLIAEMQKGELKPNQVTCSILLKNLSSKSTDEDILKTMDIIGDIEEGMDEVLLSSVMEACVRVGKPELVSEKLQCFGTTGKSLGQARIAVSGSHTYGSLIKAYGFAKDIDGVWRCWREMWSRHVRPTSVTLGCMVEAIVNNGDTEGALELVNQMYEDDHCKQAVNSVIYCSLLKGFSRERKVERAWNVYEEMQTRKIDTSIVTFNTLIDACARCSSMERVPSLLGDMGKLNIKPNVITYSTMIKGHCQLGDLQTAFALVKQLKTEPNLKPDEIMYNSLLDGCAVNGLVDEGLRVLGDMQDEGIAPSNYTLSVLVKLLSRAHKLDRAYELVQQISTKYKFKLNVHVYTNLAQACIANRAVGRALATLEDMLKHEVRPEGRSYNILIRACTHHGRHTDAVGLIRGALALPGALPFLSVPLASCYNIDYGVVNEALLSLANQKQLALPLLTDIKKLRPKVRIDAVTQRRVMGNVDETPSSEGVGGPSGPRRSRGCVESSWRDEKRAPKSQNLRSA